MESPSTENNGIGGKKNWVFVCAGWGWAELNMISAWTKRKQNNELHVLLPVVKGKDDKSQKYNNKRHK